MQRSGVSIQHLLEHGEALRALARRLVAADTADDIVQDVYVAALRSPPDPDRPARPWLGRVLRNAARMRFRGDTRRVRREDAVAVEPVTATSPADIVERLEIARALCDVLFELAEPYRATVVRHYYDGLSLADIARKDGVPEATVRWRHKHALDRLRARLDERAQGGRRGWSAALAPLVGAPGRTIVIVGTVVKKLVLAVVAALLLLAVGVWTTAYLGARGAPRSVPPSRSLEITFHHDTRPSLPRLSVAIAAAAGTDAIAATGIAGRVVDDRGSPVADATIWVADRDVSALPAARSDADGRFEIERIRPGQFDVAATAGDLVAESRTVEVVLGSHPQVELVVRVGRVVLDGRVVDEHAQEVAGAAVELRGPLSRSTVTDSEGRFRVVGLVAGMYGLAVSAGGYVYARQSRLVPHEGTVTVTVELARGVMVSGSVRTATGAPVAGATVGSTAWNLADPRLEVTSDAAGRFRIGPLPAGTVRLSAFHPSYGVSEIAILELPPASAPSTDLIFAASASIDGSVRLDDGSPASGAAITLTAKDTPARWSVIADDTGAFAIASLPVGTYEVEATARGDLPPQIARGSHRSVTLTPGTHEHVALEVVGGNEHVRGRVIDDRGAAVAGAAVWAEATRTMSPMSLDQVRTYSESDGTFDLAELPRGSYTIYASRPGGASGKLADVRAGTSSITIAIPAAASVAGRATSSDGRPLHSFLVRYQWISRSGYGGEVLSSTERAIEAADGGFVLDGLEPSRMFLVRIETAAGETGVATPFRSPRGSARPAWRSLSQARGRFEVV
jgi:RNA polymerase sigma factor (sigma-70 family)